LPPAAETTAATAVSSSELDQRLIALLAQADAPGLSMAQLVKQTGERSATLRVQLLRLGRDGKICRAGDGLKTRYRLTDQ
jgi:DNA-binding transcriptional regulator PaaX